MYRKSQYPGMPGDLCLVTEQTSFYTDFLLMLLLDYTCLLCQNIG